MFKEFRDFARRGNVVDMAVGIMIGGAFGTIVNSFVTDILMPPIGLLLGDTDFGDLFLVLRRGAADPGPYESLAAAQTAGAVTINYGAFINTLISFLILAWALFFLVRTINHLRNWQLEPSSEEETEPTVKNCPFCFSTIPVQATRCPSCTSEMSAGPV